MNALIAEAYKTHEKLAAARGADIEKTAESVLLDELVKIAEADGIDLDDLDDNDIAEIIAGAMEQAGIEQYGAEKTAGADDDGPSSEDQEKLAEADFLGRVMAHALFDEMSQIQDGGQEKFASAEEQEFYGAFEAMAVHRANDILAAVGVDTGDHVKTAAPYEVTDPQLDTAIIERAGELLAEAGWDVDAIASRLA
jgi:hypothetical protein